MKKNSFRFIAVIVLCVVLVFGPAAAFADDNPFSALGEPISVGDYTFFVDENDVSYKIVENDKISWMQVMIGNGKYMWVGIDNPGQFFGENGLFFASISSRNHNSAAYSDSYDALRSEIKDKYSKSDSYIIGFNVLSEIGSIYSLPQSGANLYIQMPSAWSDIRFDFISGDDGFSGTHEVVMEKLNGDSIRFAKISLRQSTDMILFADADSRAASVFTRHAGAFKISAFVIIAAAVVVYVIVANKKYEEKKKAEKKAQHQK